MVQHILQANNISVAYESVQAVDNVSIAVPHGQIVSVLGANGAGKTSFLGALMGIVPSEGAILSDDVRIDDLPVHERVRRGICLVPEQRELFTAMTVEDNLLVGGYIRQRNEGVRAVDTKKSIYKLFPRLEERAKQKASTLSGGERQMLALGRALMGQPRLLMLDEPSLGLAPLVIKEVFNIIERLKNDGFSILLVEQNARMALRISDYAYVMEQGKVVMEGAADKIGSDPAVIASYLGVKKSA